MSTGTADGAPESSQWKWRHTDNSWLIEIWIGEMRPRVAPLCLTRKNVVIQCVVYRRPVRTGSVTETVLTGRRSYQLTCETSLEIRPPTSQWLLFKKPVRNSLKTSESDIGIFLPEYRNIGHRSFYLNRPFSNYIFVLRLLLLPCSSFLDGLISIFLTSHYIGRYLISWWVLVIFNDIVLDYHFVTYKISIPTQLCTILVRAIMFSSCAFYLLSSIFFLSRLISVVKWQHLNSAWQPSGWALAHISS